MAAFRSSKVPSTREGPRKTFMPRGINYRKRGLLHASVLHFIVRMRYFLESWFYLKPLLQTELTDYPSFLRPKGIPKLDWPTAFAIRMLWLLVTHIREVPWLAHTLARLQIMRMLTWLHKIVMVKCLLNMNSRLLIR